MPDPEEGFEGYEYMVISTLSLKGLEKELNQLAERGWRVVTAPHMNNHPLDLSTVILERVCLRGRGE